MKSLFPVLLAAVACLLLGACGEDSSTASDGTSEASDGTTLAKAEVIDRGDAICKASTDRIEAAEREVFDGEVSEEDLLAFIAEVVVP